MLLVPVVWQDMPVIGALRLAWFDAYQQFWPRERRSAPAVIVAIDDRSLERIGQWPWPRSQIAKLIDKLREARPAAVGVDILFAESDRLSPEWFAGSLATADSQLAARLKKLPRHDAILAASIRNAPVALGIAGLETGVEITAGLTPSLQKGADAGESMRRYAASLRSLPEIDAAARGHGLLSADPEAGIVRRMPMVARIASAPVLPLSLETLRVASGEPHFVVYASSAGVEAIGIGDIVVPTQPDGRLWVHYTPHDASRFVSAVDVLSGDVDSDRLERKLVLVGVTGLGLVDYPTTALGERMPGVEIHAQVLENVFDGTLLMRPSWAPLLEGFVLIVAGAVVIGAVRRLSPGISVALLLVLLAAIGAAGFGAYASLGLLLDASVPGTAAAFLFAAMLAHTLAESNAQREALRERLHREREGKARLAGELDAARRIQIGILPKSEKAFPGERRFEVYASMEPAREVGGDLYDFFMLDDNRLFFLVGDVSGKGLPASIFMAVSKALCKSAALRRGQSVEQLLREANTEIARENPESLFVTVFAGVFDTRSGRLEYCNAGHEPPFVVAAEGEVRRLDAGRGPPLCVLDGFGYAAAEYSMEPEQILFVVSDGVTEAMNPDGSLYGVERLLRAVARARNAANTSTFISAIRADVASFVGGAEAADDLTLLAMRWIGPAASRLSER